MKRFTLKGWAAWVGVWVCFSEIAVYVVPMESTLWAMVWGMAAYIISDDVQRWIDTLSISKKYLTGIIVSSTYHHGWPREATDWAPVISALQVAGYDEIGISPDCIRVNGKTFTREDFEHIKDKP